MIVYSANKGQFVQDVKTNLIASKILNLIRERGLNAGQEREFASWHNSMKFMRDIVDDKEIDDDVQIAIEYNIPQTSKRVDFIIIGANEKRKDNIVIVELKQWTKAEVVDDDMHFCVRTYVANDKRIVCHPSYQAYSYSRFIGNYSQVVHNDGIRSTSFATCGLTCSTHINLETEGGTIRRVQIVKGCDGNTKGLARLCEGRKIEEVIGLLEGIDCKGRGTSCPDQLAKALKQL